MLALGLWRALRQAFWIWPVLLWGVAHVVAYIGLGVAPYFWCSRAASAGRGLAAGAGHGDIGAMAE